eukprot:TRINITY_DN8297_c2_g1_i2.p1 TRINITY_DN8297_c2_g1~~TRINITY_DN8297_c2_g1_i2.p1  ORF type:complete len:413 (+),score=90.46 TRINITY_DN8297_c2_g1_i2:106-1344(+)
MSMSPRGLRSVTSKVAGLGRRRQWQAALQLFNEACERPGGPPPDLPLYGAALAACERSSRWTLALDVLRRLQSGGLQPDALSLNVCVSACSKGAGGWPAAVALLFEKLQEAGVGNMVDIVSFNAAITACQRGGQWELALSIFEDAVRLGFDPDVFTYSALLSAAQSAQRWPLALQVFHERMCDAAVEPDDFVYSTIIAACEKGRLWQHALVLLARAAGRPNARGSGVLVACNAAASACCSAHQWQHAVALLDFLEDVPPDVVTYSTVIRALGHGLQWEAAVQLLSTMRTHPRRPPVTPNVIAYSSALGACEAGRAWQSALGLLDAARSQNVADAALCSSAVSCCAKALQWPSGLLLLQAMRSEGLHIGTHARGALLAAMAPPTSSQAGARSRGGGHSRSAANWRMALVMMEE